jgi:hypothetical protein
MHDVPIISARSWRNARCLPRVEWLMALDPYRRNARPPDRRRIDDPPKASRVPWIMGAIGFIAVLGIIYNLTVTGFFGKTVQLSAWTVQTPP